MVRQIVQQLIQQSDSNVVTKKATLTVIQSDTYHFEQLPQEVMNTLREKFTIVQMDAKQANPDEISEVLFLDLPLTIQSKAALGIADCPCSLLLQQLFVRGTPITCLTDHLVSGPEIMNFNYRKLFTSYQRVLKEFGIRFVSSSQFGQSQVHHDVLVAQDVEKMASYSTIQVSRTCVITYGAKQLLNEKKMKLIRGQ